MRDINGARNALTGDQNNEQSLYGGSPSVNNDYPKRLKNMGWYWGSISPSFAAELIEHEEEGKFLVRDSSSECYIFSMTFKLASEIHHVRIDHCKGQFSFGRSPKFFCKTIVEFVEQALGFSQNGNLLFFLHRDPEQEGPIRFQMKPLSRLKLRKTHSSLKNMSRAAILPYLRRDKIKELTLPHELKKFLLEPFVNR